MARWRLPKSMSVAGAAGVSVRRLTISMPARSMSCMRVFTREERKLNASEEGMATTSPAAVVSRLL